MKPAYLLLPMAALLVLAIQPAGAAGSRYISAGFGASKGWTVSADKPWWGLVDIRDCLNLFHPLVESKTGAVAGASREMTIPAGWKPPYSLRFYCADDYFADPKEHKPGMLGTESFFGHRFKQALINDQVVWERDVIDDNLIESQSLFQVDITQYVTPGKPFKLTLRAFDKVTTLDRNPQDVWFIGGVWYAAGDGKTEQPPRFHTSVWFADPVVGEEKAVTAAPMGKRPHEDMVARRHAERWPMSPPSEAVPFPVRLDLVTPCPVPSSGAPITCGVPIPAGQLRDAASLRLADRKGRALPMATRATGWWPDGSIRWVLINAIAPAGSRSGNSFRLSADSAQSQVLPASPVKVSSRAGRVVVNTGALRLEMGSDNRRLIDAIYLTGAPEPVLTNLVPAMSVNSGSEVETVTATCHKVTVVERNPVAARIEVNGSLDTGPRHIGRFTFRVYAYAGLPTLQTNFRFYNDVKSEPYNGTADDAPLEVTHFALVGDVPGRTGGAVVFGAKDGSTVTAEGGDVVLLQDNATHFAVQADGKAAAEGTQAQGWICAQGGAGSVQASMWRYREQSPNSLSVRGDKLEVGIFTPTAAVAAYKPRFGEAKRADVWLSFAPGVAPAEDQRAWGRLADEPARLFNGDLFCLSGGITVLDPDWLQNFPALGAWIKRAYGDVSTESIGNQYFGLRNYGDFPYTGAYNGGVATWRNGYYARIQGAMNWGFASGDQRWMERCFEIARHIADVDSVHIPPGHPDWNEWDGLTCALGTDHSIHNGGAPWSAFLAGDQLIRHYWVTGDPDSFNEAVANCDYILRRMPGVGSLGVREGTRPMLTLLRMWQATGDGKYLKAARKYFDRDFMTKHCIDWRRGTYIMPLYNNWRIISAGQDSMYADGLYDYYRLSGDLDAAQTVVAIADSVYAESMLPQEEGIGDFLFYPRYARFSWYSPQMAVLFCEAYDLTGDTRFLRAARAAQDRYLLNTGDGGRTTGYQGSDNFGYVDPEYAGWARELKDVRTEPYKVTGMVADPDPSNFLPK